MDDSLAQSFTKIFEKLLVLRINGAEEASAEMDDGKNENAFLSPPFPLPSLFFIFLESNSGAHTWAPGASSTRCVFIARRRVPTRAQSSGSWESPGLEETRFGHGSDTINDWVLP